MSPAKSSLYFEVQSEMGTTKHLGGRAATDEILKLCRIMPGMRVLEVGCGVGVDSRYIARKYGVLLTAVDISRKMVEKAQSRSIGIPNLEYSVADAQTLPFNANTFDIVFCQSVIAFVPDKQKAINEFRRVLKTGGFIALNEAIWKKDPPKRLLHYFSITVGDAIFLKKEGYLELLRKAGFRQVTARTHDVKMLTEIRENLRRFDLKDYLHAWYILIRGIFRDPKFRTFAWEALKMAGSAKDIFKYWHYGFFMGKK